MSGRSSGRDRSRLLRAGSQNLYDRLPLGPRFLKDRQGPIVPSVDQVPPGMEEVRLEEVRSGALYVLQFRKPR